jgi:hypothetical protein
MILCFSDQDVVRAVLVGDDTVNGSNFRILKDLVFLAFGGVI